MHVWRVGDACVEGGWCMCGGWVMHVWRVGDACVEGG